MTEKDDLTKPSSGLDLQTLNQTATWFIRSDDSKSSKRNKAIPCARWGHASAAVDNNYYVYGGTGDKANPIYWESIYRLDVETWEWINLEAGNKPPTSRDSHSMTICKNKLYIFGGSCDSESRNDLYEYDVATTTWKQVEVKGSQPTPREGHSTCLYEDKYLVVYGGWNGEETLNDCYLFDIAASTWIKVEKNVGTEPTPRESQSCCLIQNHMYLFGGQGNSVIKNGESAELFLNDLYRFKVVVENGVATATWEKLEPQGTNIPPHRSSHSITTYKNRYMFIVGGEGYPPVEGMTEADLAKQNNKNKDDDDYSCFPKNDVWYYDIETNKWNNIKMKNGAEFVSRFAHSCNVYKDYLIVFGGLRDYHHSTSDICVLSLDGSNPFVNAKAPQQKAKKETKALPVAQEADKNKGQIPNKGGIKGKTGQGEFNLLGPTHHGGHTEQAKETMDESITELEGPLVSTSFLHSLSSIISWPLAAFGLLLDNALINRAANLRIDVQTRKRKSQDLPGAAASDLEITYIVVEDDGKGWKHNDFINIFMKYDTDPTDPNAMLFEDPEINQQEEERKRRLNEYAFNLKVAGFRLGRTIIYISRSDDEISIGFISVDKRYNPDIHGNHVFLYSWKRGTQEFLTSQGQKNKDIIMNALAGIFSDEDFLQNIDKYCNRVFIMDLNPVATSKSVNGKSQDFELLLPKKGAKNNDIMVRTLDKNLKSYYTDQNNSLVELSLRTYFSYFFLDPSQANIEIYINDSAVSCANLKEVTEDRTNQTGIQKFKEEGLFDACFLQAEAQKDETSNKEQKDASAAGNKRKSRNQKSSDKSDFNQGVLVYFNNRLIRRLETPKLGNLDFLSFQSRQIQNKPGASLFSVNGYIEVKQCLKPNMFKTEIENPYYSNYLYSVVIPKLQSGSNLNENDKRKLEGANEEYDAVTKKVKTNPV